MRRIKIIENQNKEFNGIIKLCPKKGVNYNCYFILTNDCSFDGQIAIREESYKFSWCIESERNAKKNNLNLKTLKNFDDYDWPYCLPSDHYYHIIFIDNSNFEDIEL